MATLRDIKRRINSVKNTQQITKAMKLVAAARLRRAQERMLKARPYAHSLDDMLGHVSAKVDPAWHPLLAVRAPRHIALVVITGDRGLAGSFNANVIRRATSEFQAAQRPGVEVALICAGRKGYEHFNRRGYPILAHFTGFFNNLDFVHAQGLGRLIQEQYLAESLDRIYLVYNEFKSVIQQKLVVQQLLPIVPRPPREEKYPADFLFEPSPVKILDTLCPKYINIIVWQALLESYAAELGARMAAMDAATENAKEIIAQLTLHYNKARQAAITKELLEIVGGAEALTK
ncbi:MAG: ATP synthase F1 subunit gamma [candidate division KSB1 bacterium]|nr:ATP synthase F1 subunit gamma [candidate division KSB1 bacterium]MDZ7273056.1 ATP synthase F1 subunit gamma [candidate division KSB1 bacterium]MDZ7285159.1 ATP synthase F1 subunit gamma [candidate division KSB1 bacterium]MDZ7298191.1 ATP synthase F1 subunit gamma [candidate division KSB1 bacterium]MDZ7307856.1 ATP synthase F1 subunit gamma [candidate division KSB1 bacterium]